MKTSRYKDATPGFGCKILSDTYLGSAMLIAELPDETYQPLNIPSTLDEAQEMIADYSFPAGTTYCGMGARTGRHEGRWSLGGSTMIAATMPVPYWTESTKATDCNTCGRDIWVGDRSVISGPTMHCELCGSRVCCYEDDGAVRVFQEVSNG